MTLRLFAVQIVIAGALVALMTGQGLTASLPPSEVFANFDSGGYGAWKVEGNAFGPAPAVSAAKGQPVAGCVGAGFANSDSVGETGTGKLTSPDFSIQQRFISFLIGGGYRPHQELGECAINLIVDGKTVRTSTGRYTDQMSWDTWDVNDLVGKTAHIEIVDNNEGYWGHIEVDQIVFGRSPQPDPGMPSFFGDNAVLQRDVAVPIWGWALPGEKIKVTLGAQAVSTVADMDGKWKITLAKMPAGGNFDLTVTGETAAITSKNVTFGEVWLASGQSNMEFGVNGCASLYASDIASSTDPDLRMIRIPEYGSLQQPRDPGGRWQPANPNSVLGFSAVAYFYARSLREKLKVPIGIINAPVGATAIEAWTAREVLNTVPAFKDETDKAIDALEHNSDNLRQYGVALRDWEQLNGAGDDDTGSLAAGWYRLDFDDSGWANVSIPSNVKGLGLKSGGVAWLRKNVTLPASAVGKAFFIATNVQSQCGIQVYFNGTQVLDGNRAPQFFKKQYMYYVPGTLVKAGTNAIAIRIHALCAESYFWTTTDKMGFPVANAAELDNKWKCKIEKEFAPLTGSAKAAIPALPTASIRNTPTVLFNAMISPLIPCGLRGVIWYQGESNVGRWETYKQHLEMNIADWRKRWGNATMPFYIVQLANYYTTHPDPYNSHQAAIREAQLQTVRETPGTGLAVAIDEGDGGIHPLRKKPVGERLALVAMSKAYDSAAEYSGPVYLAAKSEGGAMRVTFDHASSGLVVKGTTLKNFAVAGDDQKFHWATASIEGATIVVSSPDVPKPVAVRYAWDDNPLDCNLYNGEGLPASPFRSDNWPL
ncbi:MAG: sialate O-acetylesterase [Capsulimonadaceae bacterium]|nr:sialate O-acetylesterase [Capsulimonadaceae bacterium]